MSRWPPGAGERLKRSALELFAARGFADVKASEIAAAAGMTERSFFRHFRAKEDVLFDDEAALDDALTQAVVEAPARASTRTLMQTAVDLLGRRLSSDREFHRTLARVISSHPTLRARALLRDQEIGGALASGLRRRGYAPARAALVAAVAAATCRLAYDAWVRDEGPATLAETFATWAEATAREFGA